MTRTFTEFSKQDKLGRQLVEELATIQGDPERYRRQMVLIGSHLASAIIPALREPSVADSQICVVCTVEDADFLARGVIEKLEAEGLADRIHFLCLWNEKIGSSGVSVSPISRQYYEDFSADKTVFIVVKSIISGACVVKTNLTRAISYSNPTKIFVAAPVMLAGAETRLSHEFSKEISSKFEFFNFITDSEKRGDEVIPGIGGSVYELLGFGDSKSKNKYVPSIVKERRKKIFGDLVPA